MLFFRRSSFFRSVVLSLTFIALLPACYSYPTVGSNGNVPTVLPTVVQLTLNDGHQVELESAVVQGDSIVGMTRGSTVELAERIAVHVDDVIEIKHKKPNTILVVIPIVAAALFMMNAALDESFDGN